MNRIKLLIFSCFISMLLLSSCNPLAVQGPEPAFIDIPELRFIHDPAQGSREHDIKYVEVFFENFSIGFYEIPAKISVIPTTDVSTLIIKPAYQRNGQQNEITVYPMMTWHVVDQTFETYETYEIIPEFKYDDLCVFDLLEGFESGNSLTYDLDNIDSTRLVRTTSTAKTGSYSGLMTSKNGEYIAVATEFLFLDLDNDGRPVFVELDYKNNSPFAIGLLGEGNGQQLEIFRWNQKPQSDWNKIYFDITPFIIQVPAKGYRLFFILDSTSSSGSDSELYIDNLKLIHIK